MNDTVRVELHCHSAVSDGALAPEAIAGRLASAGVRYAALTDHFALGGQPSFLSACRHRSIGVIPGIELTAELEGRELHLLGYGFASDHAELSELLPSLRPPPHPIRAGIPTPRRLSAAEAISLVHRAGGLAFLAHPLVTEPDMGKLVPLLEKLHKAGLDGLEVFRPELAPGVLSALNDQAVRLGFLRSAGTDSHFTATDKAGEPGIDMPREAWKAFRDAVLASSARYKSPTAPFKTPGLPEQKAAAIHWKAFARHIVLPSLLALLLFGGVLVFAVLPTFERALLERKRETIRELTNAAWSVLAEAEAEEQQGRLNGADARGQAKKRIKAMRYGCDGKDYFWLQDTTPRMVMHPYRRDLNGTDLSGFTDPRGERIFVVFARLAREKKEGYVHYVWQWKDDPARLEPKESYIRLFEPWGWIIGTGLYTHDVQAELRQLKHRLALLSAGIFALVALLLAYLMRQSLSLERKRTRAEEDLKETTARYRTLANAATEGMLFVHDGRCLYGNPMGLELLGYSQNELELIDLTDILPALPENGPVLSMLGAIHDALPESPIPGILSRKDGTRSACLFSLQSAGLPLAEGFLLLLRRTATPGAEPAAPSGGLLGRLLKLPASIAHDLRGEIDRAATPDGITAICGNAPGLVQSLLDNGASAPDIARLLSSVTDAATRRLITLGIGIHGEPPVPFAFIALGSQGRSEQTLFTDQDNAIIHAPGSDPGAIAAYFGKLAGFVCDGLARSGYRQCKGRVMADNPEWCRPLAAWKEAFSAWIERADLRELMEFSIFFDFRNVYGDESLTRELRTHVMQNVARSGPFLPQIARHALEFKAPLRLFGIVVSSSGKGDKPRRIDLKAASLPIVSFARLYSLQQGVIETNTCDRIDELVRKGFLLPSKREEIVTAHALLLRLRLRRQAAIIQAGGEPDNLVDPSALGHIEEAILRECFNEIDLLQNRIRKDFLGGA